MTPTCKAASVGPPPLQVRRARRADAGPIAHLYYDTVRHVNVRDYGEAQIEAWAPRVYDARFWHRRFKRYRVFVAVAGAQIVGFAELGEDGHIDCFYVHHRWQGCGVGSLLMRHIVAEARKRHLSRLFADVSLTAEGFFRRAGFHVRRRQKKIYHRRAFIQFFMEKRLGRRFSLAVPFARERRRARRIVRRSARQE